MQIKLLFLDIEISPTLAAVWGLWNQNINVDNILGNSEVLSWAAKWHGSDEVEYSSLGMTSKKNMIHEVYKLLEEADAVVTYNGNRFDLPILSQEFLMAGLTPPAPYHSIDLLQTMKRRFRGTSNKLSYWLSRLELGEKVQHRGPQLWLDCMNGDKEAFAEMEEYNIGDVVELEKLYDRVLPWIPNHPNRAYGHEGIVCPYCESEKVQARGFTKSNNNGLRYHRFQCRNIPACGGWFQSGKAEPNANPCKTKAVR